MITKETATEAALITEAVFGVEQALNQTADGTNWTVADSLSNIALQLERIADKLEEA